MPAIAQPKLHLNGLFGLLSGSKSGADTGNCSCRGVALPVRGGALEERGDLAQFFAKFLSVVTQLASLVWRATAEKSVSFFSTIMPARMRGSRVQRRRYRRNHCR
jgi:hypothetical protein